MIEKQVDPRTRKQLLFAVGKVEGVYFNELKNVKTYQGPRGPWTPTHAINVVIDGNRVGLGLTDKNAVNCKDVDGNYHELEKGMEVSAEVEESGEYKGVMQYSSKSSLITILNPSVPDKSTSPQKAASKQLRGKNDDTQVVAGNARTAAFAFLKGKAYKDVNQINRIVEKMAETGHKVREQYRKDNPELDEFQVGVSVGQALVLAAGISKTEEDIDKYVTEILKEVIPYSVEVVKSLSSPKKEKKAVVEESNESEGSVGTEEEYFECDIPFN